MYNNLSNILYCIQDGNTTLHNACSSGNYNIVDLLIKAGVNTDIANNVSLLYDNVYCLFYFFRETIIK